MSAYTHKNLYDNMYIIVCIHQRVDADVPPLPDGIKVQKGILPGFGFEASKEGVQDGGFVESLCLEGF